ncbi:hypothetical protein A9Q91_00835 [Candidatus Gracilibacteria bacterium 28_42_T64]|nr:hypothetical protein A9Q91_00835 [Candidatus Gracilibacteria bacterium 28_42_T64]
MNKGKQDGFTVVELIIAITIFFMLSMASFVPYNYYVNKAKLKTTVKEISQSIYEARNMAINGVISSTGNVSIGIYFDNSEEENNKIHFLSYPYSFTGVDISTSGSEIESIKTLVLQPGMQIDSIHGNENGLFFFQAISGSSEYFYWESGIRKDILTAGEDTIDISISYKGSTTRNLQKNITYYIKTNIIDY